MFLKSFIFFTNKIRIIVKQTVIYNWSNVRMCLFLKKLITAKDSNNFTKIFEFYILAGLLLRVKRHVIAEVYAFGVKIDVRKGQL